METSFPGRSIASALTSIRAEPSPGPLEFVTVSDPRDLKDRRTQHKIRRHAGQSTARKNPRKIRLITRSFDIAPVDRASAVPFSREDAPPSQDLHRPMGPRQQLALITTEDPRPKQPQLNLYEAWESQPILRPLGAGIGLNPLQRFPVPAEQRPRLLIEFLLDFKRRRHDHLLPFCFTFGLEDRSMFYLVLANASALYGKQVGRLEGDSLETASYYEAGLQDVNSRLRDPVDRVSEGVIGAIVAFACQEVQRGNFARWKMHMQGLKQIVDMRGGLVSLSTAYMLRLKLFFVDMNGALGMDAPPYFPIADYCPEPSSADGASQILEALLLSLRSSFGGFSDTCDALLSVAALSKYINEQGTSADFFQDDNIRSQRLLPVAHRVLRLARFSGLAIEEDKEQEIYDAAPMTREATRLALLLYVSLLKERFSIAPNCIDIQKDRLIQFLTRSSADWTVFPSLWLWIYATLAVTMTSRERGWVIAKIAALMHQMGVGSWLDAVSIIRGIAWVDGMGVDGLEMLGLDVQHYQYPGF